MKTFYTLLLASLTYIPVMAQETATTDEALIEKLIIDSFDEIWSARSADNINTYYTEDFLLLEHGELWNNDTIAHYFKKSVPANPLPKRVNTIDIIEIKVFGNRAWVAYHNHATVSVEEKIIRKAYWLESATAIKTEEGWKLDMLHSTRVKNELFREE